MRRTPHTLLGGRGVFYNISDNIITTFFFLVTMLFVKFSSAYNQSINQSINKSIDQSINKSINQTLHTSRCKHCAESDGSSFQDPHASDCVSDFEMTEIKILEITKKNVQHSIFLIGPAINSKWNIFCGPVIRSKSQNTITGVNRL